MEFRVLGSLEVRRDGVPVDLFGSGARTLLAALLVDAGNVVSVDRLAIVLWGDDPPADPRNAVQTAVARLRERLGAPNPVVTRRPGYLADVGAEELDAARFEALVDDADRQREDAAAVRALLNEALGLWGGDAYVEFADGIAREEALRLQERRLVAVERLAEARLRLGEADDVAADLRGEIARQPLRERLVELQMEALARADRTAAALAEHRDYRQRLVDETGLEPSPSLQDLEGRVLRGELAGSARTTDRGARTHHGGPHGRSHLPVVQTSLIGRQAETAAVRRALADGGPITVTGVGGVGKTRLAAEVARSVREEDEREVSWVELAPVDDPDAVAYVMAEATGADLSGSSAPDAVLVDALSGRDLLLVVDNAEHLIDRVADLVGEIARRCPTVEVVVTSRQPLAIQAEHVVKLDPLAVPTDADAPSPAVELFRERADRVGARPGSEQQVAVIELCRELDGLPLAIELAAARAAVLAPTHLLELLRADGTRAIGSRRGGPDRHRDLWSVADWSYQLLTDDEQLLFERLGIFAGSFDLDAAHAVCAPEGWTATTTTRHVATLVERSLVSPDGRDGSEYAERYRMLRPLRELARQRAADRGHLAALDRRYVGHVVAEVERAAEPPLRRTGQRRILDVLDDVRELRRRTRTTNDIDVVGRLVTGMFRFEYLRRGVEFTGWAGELVAQEELTDSPHAPVLHAAAAVSAWRSGDLRRAEELARTGAALGAGHDDPARRLAFEALGDVATFEGRLGDAADHFAASVRLARIADDPDTEALGLASVALVRAYGGDLDAALARVEEAANVADAGEAVQAFVRYAQGECLADVDPQRATALVDEAAALARSAEAWFVDGVARVTSASLRARHGEPLDALPVFADLVGHWRRSGSWQQQWTTLRNLAELLVQVGAEDAAVAMTSSVCAHQADSAVFGAESARLDEAMATARHRLGEDRFRLAQEQGASTSRQQAVDHALATIARISSPTADAPFPDPRTEDHGDAR